MKISKGQVKIIGIAMGVVFLVGIMGLIYFNKKDVNYEGVDSFIVEASGNASSGVDGEEVNGDNRNAEKSGETMDNKSGELGKANDLIYIHIIGEVLNPGVITLNKGQRIVDAIGKAGGATLDADLNKINLAYVLSDGQKIRIPSVYDEESSDKDELISGGSIGGNGVGFGEAGNNTVGKVNINTANQTELETIVGIGPSLAARIISYREKNGGFKKIEEIKNVSGIGDVKFEELKNYIEI